MRVIAADLHVHTALSPCADAGMVPSMIVYAAIAAELEMIAICDHNHAGNAAAVQAAARRIAGDLFDVIAGMEITTREEAHLVGLFPDAERAEKAAETLAAHLPAVRMKRSHGNKQLLLNGQDEVVGSVDAMLSLASDLSLEEAAALVRSHDGLLIAAHVDRPSFSVVSQLGFLPETIAFDALEISEAGVKQGRAQEFHDAGRPLISSSDAHFIDNIGDGRTFFYMEAPSFEEIRRVFNGDGERKCALA